MGARKEKKLKAAELLNLGHNKSKPEENSKLRLKKEEVSKVIAEKMKHLLEKKLSYLEYVEMREELVKLKNFQKIIDKKLQSKS